MNTLSNKLFRLTVLALLTSLTFSACGGPQESDALEALVEPDGETVGFLDFSNGSDKSFGIFICVESSAVTLESVEVVETEGDIEFLGGFVYQESDGFIGAVDGFPPSGLNESTLSDVDGFIVEAKCENDQSGTRTQLLVGAERTGTGGGVIDGIRVLHSEGMLTLDGYRIVLCGDAFEYCEDLAPNE